MGILNIREARREGAKMVIGLAGQSGGGKTLTALYIARGMVNSSQEIGFLDTENKRGSLYADELDGPFMIGNLYPPFSPARYSQSIREMQDAGIKVLIIDSVTHEWEGEGGCSDIADNGKGMPNWKLAKAEHKKFMNTLLQCDMHVIVCVRAREQMDFRNPSKPIPLGVQPVCEKNFMFEMTASVMIENEGLSQTHLKVPKELKPVFGNGQGHIGQEVGRGIMQWVNAGAKVDPLAKSWENKLTMAASGGVAALGKEWAKTPKHIQTQLIAHKDQCKHSAIAYDKINAEASAEPEIDMPNEGFAPVESEPAPVDEPKTATAPADTVEQDIGDF